VKTIVLSHTGWLDAEGELLPGRRGFWRWRPAAIAVAVVSVCLWAPDFVDHHDVILPGIYLVLVAVAATFISVSAARVPRSRHHRQLIPTAGQPGSWSASIPTRTA